jgi:hypothetical protein
VLENRKDWSLVMGILEYFRGRPPHREAPTAPLLPDIVRWAASFDIVAKPWLILGKGPSYDRVRDVRLADYYTCALNHVVREGSVDLAHIIDIDVAADCAEALERNARWLVLPYHPHVRNTPTHKTIEDFARELPVLRSLHRQGRLFWYNLSTAKTQVGTSPVVTGKFFSAEAVVNLLATCGVKTIRSLGIDGGSSYAATYNDLVAKTLLSNGRTSFDRQFEQIAATIRRTGLFYAPLHKQAPIRVFVGTDRTQMLAARVLEYSIKCHASMSVAVVPMCDVPVPLPRDPRNHPRTGFSFARFLIPSLCGYAGRAIYVDADMLVFQDISRLWDLSLEEADVLCAEQPAAKGRVRQYSVMVLDCGGLRWNVEDIVRGLDDGRYDYRQLMQDFCVVPPERIAATIPYEWNSLESYEAGRTGLVHYTDMPTQPWVCDKNPHAEPWYSALRSAVAEGFIRKQELYREVEQGNVLPDLPQRIGFAPHPDFRRLARAFMPPHRRVIRA